MTQLGAHKNNFSTVPFTGQFYALLPTQPNSPTVPESSQLADKPKRINYAALLRRPFGAASESSQKPKTQSLEGGFVAKPFGFSSFASLFILLFNLFGFGLFNASLSHKPFTWKAAPLGRQVLIICMHIYIIQTCGAFCTI